MAPLQVPEHTHLGHAVGTQPLLHGVALGHVHQLIAGGLRQHSEPAGATVDAFVTLSTTTTTAAAPGAVAPGSGRGAGGVPGAADVGPERGLQEGGVGAAHARVEAAEVVYSLEAHHGGGADHVVEEAIVVVVVVVVIIMAPEEEARPPQQRLVGEAGAGRVAKQHVAAAEAEAALQEAQAAQDVGEGLRVAGAAGGKGREGRVGEGLGEVRVRGEAVVEGGEAGEAGRGAREVVVVVAARSAGGRVDEGGEGG